MQIGLGVVRWIVGDSLCQGVALSNLYIFIVLKVHNHFVTERSRANHLRLFSLIIDRIEHVNVTQRGRGLWC